MRDSVEEIVKELIARVQNKDLYNWHWERDRDDNGIDEFTTMITVREITMKIVVQRLFDCNKGGIPTRYRIIFKRHPSEETEFDFGKTETDMDNEYRKHVPEKIGNVKKLFWLLRDAVKQQENASKAQEKIEQEKIDFEKKERQRNAAERFLFLIKN